MSSTEIVVRPQALLSLAEIKEVAALFAASGLFEGRSPAQAAVQIMAGQELGVPAFAAMNGIYIIKGRTFVGAHLLAARIKASGKYDYRVITLNDTACEIDFIDVRTGQVVGRSTYTMGDAAKAGTTRNPTWNTHQQDMLYASAMRKGAKRYCPDVVNGLDIAEGEPVVIDAEAEVPPPAPASVLGQPQDTLETPPAKAPAEQPGGNGNAPTGQPMSPDALRDYLHAAAEQHAAAGDTPKSDRARGLIFGVMEEIFAGGPTDPRTARHDVMEWAFGVQSGKDLTDAQVLALRDLLRPSKAADGRWVADPLAAQEIRAAQAVAVRAPDQPDLFGAGEAGAIA